MFKIRPKKLIMLKYLKPINDLIMVNEKLSVEEKREIARNDIMRISLELFLTKGYDKTTTRDIITKAGILNGSLYNRFRNKEEILICIVNKATEEMLRETADILKHDSDVMVAAAFPGAVELYVSSRWDSVAKLIYEVHCKWDAIQMYTDLFQRWFDEFMSKYGYKAAQPNRVDMILASLIGSLGNMVGCYAHGVGISFEEAVKHYISIVSVTLHIPVLNLDEIVGKLKTILSSKDMMFMGYQINDDRFFKKPR